MAASGGLVAVFGESLRCKGFRVPLLSAFSRSGLVPIQTILLALVSFCY